jgi:uncharacterized Fe-S radical SAM superfamily protein PflX
VELGADAPLEGLELLKGIVDVWLPDFEFGIDGFAHVVAGIDGYAAMTKHTLIALHNEGFVQEELREFAFIVAPVRSQRFM